MEMLNTSAPNTEIENALARVEAETNVTQDRIEQLKQKLHKFLLEGLPQPTPEEDPKVKSESSILRTELNCCCARISNNNRELGFLISRIDD